MAGARQTGRILAPLRDTAPVERLYWRQRTAVRPNDSRDVPHVGPFEGDEHGGDEVIAHGWRSRASARATVRRRAPHASLVEIRMLVADAVGHGAAGAVEEPRPFEQLVLGGHRSRARDFLDEEGVGQP